MFSIQIITAFSMPTVDNEDEVTTVPDFYFGYTIIQYK